MKKNNGARVLIKFDTDSIRYTGLFESLTGVVVKDCMVNDDKIIFVVKEGQAGMAIGKKGVNIKNLQEMLNKRVEIIEFNSNPLIFLNNIFRPLKISNAYLSEKNDEKKIIKISFDRDKFKVRPKLRKAKFLVKKYFNIDDVIIS